MAVKRTATQSYQATVAKFRKLNLSMDAGAEMIRQNLLDDITEFTSGAQPQGKARLKWLRRTGHPYGRGQSAAESTATGRKRGINKEIRPREKQRTGRVSAPTLPIGNISGKLQRSKFVTKTKQGLAYKITAGFDRSAGGALFAVFPQGTKKMVGRGLWGKGEAGALGKRVRMYRKAFRDRFIKLSLLP
jgi:hypothetical protein